MTDPARVASQVLDQVGAFAFIFPGVGQIVGGAFSFAGGVAALFEDSPPNPGPSRQDLDDDINKVAALVVQATTNQETFDIKVALDPGLSDYANLQVDYANAIANPGAVLVQHGSLPPDIVALARAFAPNGNHLRTAISGMSNLTKIEDRIAALVLHADTRSKLHGTIRQYLNVEMSAAAWNYAYQADDSTYPNRADYPITWKKWYEPPPAHASLVTAFQQSLGEAIDEIESTVDTVHTSFRTRLARSRAAAAAAKVPARQLKTTWTKITDDEYLDRITEADLDALRGTPTTMGVVDFWKETLHSLWAIEHNNQPFVRGDKFNPIRKVPTVWLSPAEVATAKAAASGSSTDMLETIHGTATTPVSANSRPLVGPLRFIPWIDNNDPKVHNQPVLYVVVVNTLPEPLLIESIDVGLGGLLTEATVASYPHLDANQTNGWTVKEHSGSANPKSWIDAAPGDGRASVGMWQVMGRPSAAWDVAGLSIKFTPVAALGNQPVYVAAEYRTDRYNSIGVGTTEMGDASAFYEQQVQSLGHITPATAGGVLASITPNKPTAGQPNDIAATFYIGAPS